MEDPINKTLVLFTDGACRGNPGPGGWGVLIVEDAVETELFGSEPHTTNNRMELSAAIRGLEAIDLEYAVSVYTDSQYVRNGVTQWIGKWKANGWKTAGRKPVKNQDLWQQLDLAASRRSVEWHWVRGHSGHPQNEKADALANRAIDLMLAKQTRKGGG
jgi:ribonuclease HI